MLVYFYQNKEKMYRKKQELEGEGKSIFHVSRSLLLSTHTQNCFCTRKPTNIEHYECRYSVNNLQ